MFILYLSLLLFLSLSSFLFLYLIFELGKNEPC